LALAQCASVVVDPNRHITVEKTIGTKPICAIYRATSDDYFARFNPQAALGATVELAFLDGTHLCEFLLRDFINVERTCRRNSIIVLHDCLPVEWPMAERQHTRTPIRQRYIHSWAGDVWRTALLLKRRRPDLEITSYDAPPTGLICITNLNPNSSDLADDYHACVRQMMAQSLQQIGIGELFYELNVEPTATLQNTALIASRFWL
jgi:hypothetical protein